MRFTNNVISDAIMGLSGADRLTEGATYTKEDQGRVNEALDDITFNVFDTHLRALEQAKDLVKGLEKTGDGLRDKLHETKKISDGVLSLIKRFSVDGLELFDFGVNGDEGHVVSGKCFIEDIEDFLYAVECAYGPFEDGQITRKADSFSVRYLNSMYHFPIEVNVDLADAEGKIIDGEFKDNVNVVISIWLLNMDEELKYATEPLTEK